MVVVYKTLEGLKLTRINNWWEKEPDNVVFRSDFFERAAEYVNRCNERGLNQ